MKKHLDRDPLPSLPQAPIQETKLKLIKRGWTKLTTKTKIEEENTLNLLR
jgi:hypothetical protein